MYRLARAIKFPLTGRGRPGLAWRSGHGAVEVGGRGGRREGALKGHLERFVLKNTCKVLKTLRGQSRNGLSKNTLLESPFLRTTPSPLVAHDCGYPLSRYTCRATRVAADFLDFREFCRCSTGVALHPLKILVYLAPPLSQEVSHRNLGLKRCRATLGCRSYSCGCRATLCN